MICYKSYLNENESQEQLREYANKILSYKTLLNNRIVRNKYRKSYILYLLAEFGINTEEVKEFAKNSLSKNSVHVRNNALRLIQNSGNEKNYIPVSILVPAYNEEVTIIDTINSLLYLDYPEYEIIVINDGSTDNTAKVIIDYFNLKKVARPINKVVPCKDMKEIYENDDGIKIVLVNKENGGKSDALNMGINVSRYPLFVCVDADSMLQHNSLKKIVEPFLEDENTIAAGGNIKVSNQVVLGRGRVVDVTVPKKKMVIFQMIEYLRVFLNSRVALNGLNANMIISGAFGIYNKQAVINVGGYSLDVIGEDMEIVVKMHAFYRKNKLPFRIAYVPDAICWTQVLESHRLLKNQRRRWHTGLSQSLKNHWFVSFNPKYGAVGLIAYPYFLIFEYITPILEVLGIATIILSFILKIINVRFFIFIY